MWRYHQVAVTTLTSHSHLHTAHHVRQAKRRQAQGSRHSRGGWRVWRFPGRGWVQGGGPTEKDVMEIQTSWTHTKTIAQSQSVDWWIGQLMNRSLYQYVAFVGCWCDLWFGREGYVTRPVTRDLWGLLVPISIYDGCRSVNCSVVAVFTDVLDVVVGRDTSFRCD